MKKILSIIALAFIFIGCSSDENTEETLVSNETRATYKVEITFNWTAENFPMNFPANDHFSPLIGWVHNSSTDLFKENTLATSGIKQMAETGGTSILKAELKEKIEAGEGLSVISGSGLGSGSGIITIDEIEITKENSLVTLSTMIAPSPDWYVGLVNANLYEDDKFISEKTFEATIYDAGTDSGVNYTSSNSATNPQEKITKYISSPFNTGKTIATVKFTKL